LGDLHFTFIGLEKHKKKLVFNFLVCRYKSTLFSSFLYIIMNMLPSISNLLSPPLHLHINQSPLNIPLEGDDPPQRLRLPMPPQPSSPLSPKLLYKSPWPNLSPTPSSSSTSCSSTASFDVSSGSISPSLEHFSRSRTTSEDNYYRRRVTSNSPPLVERQRSISTSSAPTTQIVFDSSGQPVLKRRRGRPPTIRDANNFDGGWTFLAPTVWDVHVSEEQKQREIQADHKERLISVVSNVIQNDHLMNDAMAAFTNSNMDTILHMPRKKRGRKPKTHIVGNSCFVWKDLTSTRSAPVKQTKE
jgi:hypothetical protein